jgi:hypothetical protein
MQRSPIDEEKGEEGVGGSDSGSGAGASGSTSDGSTAVVPAANPKGPKKFHNGWNRQLENLVAEWADKASCYQWMHQKTEVRFQRFNYYFTIPVIVMSTLTGTANFATSSIASGEQEQKLVTFGIGAISLIAGIISTVANFLRYAQGSEAHRVAAISWGKFQRFISIELSLHPNERMDAMSFLKMGRIELDRLIEQSPPIPTKTVEEFYVAFRDKKDIKRPEIAGGIEHTRIFDDRESRLAKVAAEAAYVIQQKKGLMRQLVMEDIDKRIVSRAQDERLAMEEELRQEIMTTAKDMAQSVARETALSAVRSVPTFAYKNAATGINVPGGSDGSTATATAAAAAREELATVIPEGAVKKVRDKIRRRLSIIGGPTDRPLTVAEAAAAVGAIRGLTVTPPQSPKTPPSSVRIEIREDDEAAAIEAQMAVAMQRAVDEKV